MYTKISRMKRSQLLIMGFLFFYVSLAASVSTSMAKPVVEETYVGLSEKESAIEAREDILKEAMENISFKSIRKIIGDNSTRSHRSLIKEKIVKQSAKYILFFKNQDLKKTVDGYEMTVRMTLSLKNLKEMLLAEGLLYKSYGPPKVIPMISFADKVHGNQLSWWLSESISSAQLYDYATSFGGQLKEELSVKGFYVVSPLKYNIHYSLPRALRFRNPRQEDFLDVARFFGGAALIRGNVEISRSEQVMRGFKISVRLEGIQVSNGRVIAEVLRDYTTEPGSFNFVVSKKISEIYPLVVKDLAVQVYNSWRQGTFGSHLVQLVLNGFIKLSSV